MLRLLLLATLVASVISSGNSESCPVGKFGDSCRFDCHCDTSESCDQDTGRCFYGCASDYFGPGCQLMNISGDASQSSTVPSRSEQRCRGRRCYYSHYSHYETVVVSYDAENAIDTENPSECARIPDASSRPWWALDMKGDFVVTKISLKVNDDVNVEVGPGDSLESSRNALCKSVPEGSHDITCTPRIRGRYVILDFMDKHWTYTEICQVRVSGYSYNNYCPRGRYGPACLYNCSCLVENERCHHVTGACPSGCSPQKVGVGCDIDFKLKSDIEVQSDNGFTTVFIPEFEENVDSDRGVVDIMYILEVNNHTWRVVEKEPGQRNVTIKNLRPYTKYRVRVTLARRAVTNMILRGDWGKVINFTTPCGHPKVGPVIDTITTEIAKIGYPSRANATVQWKGVSNDNANCKEVESYMLRYRVTDGNWTNFTLVGIGEAQPILIGELIPNTMYEFKMVAVNNPNLGTEGEVVASKTPEGMLGPVTLTVINNTILHWQDPQDNQGEVKGYRYRYSEIESIGCLGLENPDKVVDTKEQEMNLKNLKPYKKYNVTVCAVNAFGCGVTVSRIIRTPSIAPATKPSPATVTGVLSTSARLRFSHLPCLLRNGDFHHFAVLLLKNGTAVQELNTEHEVYDVKNLLPDTEYTVKYAWVNEIGSSPYSTETSFKTDTDVPGPPELHDHVSSPWIIALLWKPPPVTNGNLTEYESSCSLPGVKRLVARQPATNDDVIFHKFDGGLIAKRLYKCKVRAYSSRGPGRWSRPMNIKTDYRNTLPTRNLTMISTNNTVKFTWRKPLVDCGLLGYKLTCQVPFDNRTLTVIQRDFFKGNDTYSWETETVSAMRCHLSTILPPGEGIRTPFVEKSMEN